MLHGKEVDIDVDVNTERALKALADFVDSAGDEKILLDVGLAPNAAVPLMKAFNREMDMFARRGAIGIPMSGIMSPVGPLEAINVELGKLAAIGDPGVALAGGRGAKNVSEDMVTSWQGILSPATSKMYQNLAKSDTALGVLLGKIEEMYPGTSNFDNLRPIVFQKLLSELGQFIQNQQSPAGWPKGSVPVDVTGVSSSVSKAVPPWVPIFLANMVEAKKNAFPRVMGEAIAQLAKIMYPDAAIQAQIAEALAAAKATVAYGAFDRIEAQLLFGLPTLPPDLAPYAPGYRVGGGGGGGYYGGGGDGGGGFWANMFGRPDGIGGGPWWRFGGYLPKFGSPLQLAGFGTESVLAKILGIGGSFGGAVLGGGLLGLGSLGVMGTGMATDLAGIGQAANDLSKLSQAQQQLQQSQAIYNAMVKQFGKNSQQAQSAFQNVIQAQAQYNFVLNSMPAAARKALTSTLTIKNQFASLFDKFTGPAEAVGAKIIGQFIKGAEKFLPTIGKFALKNMNIMERLFNVGGSLNHMGLLKWLQSGAFSPFTKSSAQLGLGKTPIYGNIGQMGGLGILRDLEQIFTKNLPQGIHMMTQAFELFLKTVDVAAHYTGPFLKVLDKFFTKWNSPKGFAVWATWIGKLIGMFRVWLHFGSAVFHMLAAIFAPAAGFGTGFIQMLTQIVKMVTKWADANRGLLKGLFGADFKLFFKTLMPLAKAGMTVFLSFLTALIKIETPLRILLTHVLVPIANIIATLVSNPFVATMLGWYFALSKVLGATKLLYAALKGLKDLKIVTGLSKVFKGGLFGSLVNQGTTKTGEQLQMDAANIQLDAANLQMDAAKGALRGDIPGGGGGLASTAARDATAVEGEVIPMAEGGFLARMGGASGLLSKIGGTLMGGFLGFQAGSLLSGLTEGGAKGAQGAWGHGLTKVGGGLMGAGVGMMSTGVGLLPGAIVTGVGALATGAGEVVSHWHDITHFFSSLFGGGHVSKQTQILNNVVAKLGLGGLGGGRFGGIAGSQIVAQAEAGKALPTYIAQAIGKAFGSQGAALSAALEKALGPAGMAAYKAAMAQYQAAQSWNKTVNGATQQMSAQFNKQTMTALQTSAKQQQWSGQEYNSAVRAFQQNYTAGVSLQQAANRLVQSASGLSTAAIHLSDTQFKVAVGLGLSPQAARALGLANAAGGIAMSPTWGMFGEAGPEALIPLNRLNSIMQGMHEGGGGGFSYNPIYNIYVTSNSEDAIASQIETALGKHDVQLAQMIATRRA